MLYGAALSQNYSVRAIDELIVLGHMFRRIPHLGSEIHFIDDMVDSHVHIGEQGHMFTTLKVGLPLPSLFFISIYKTVVTLVNYQPQGQYKANIATVRDSKTDVSSFILSSM